MPPGERQRWGSQWGGEPEPVLRLDAGLLIELDPLSTEALKLASTASSCLPTSIDAPPPLGGVQLTSTDPHCREWATDASAVHLAAIHGSGDRVRLALLRWLPSLRGRGLLDFYLVCMAHVCLHACCIGQIRPPWLSQLSTIASIPCPHAAAHAHGAGQWCGTALCT